MKKAIIIVGVLFLLIAGAASITGLLYLSSFNVDRYTDDDGNLVWKPVGSEYYYSYSPAAQSVLILPLEYKGAVSFQATSRNLLTLPEENSENEPLRFITESSGKNTINYIDGSGVVIGTAVLGEYNVPREVVLLKAVQDMPAGVLFSWDELDRRSWDTSHKSGWRPRSRLMRKVVKGLTKIRSVLADLNMLSEWEEVNGKI